MLNGPVPWRSAAAASAGTVHLAESVDELTRCASRIARGLVPDRPFLLMGQMTKADTTRSPLDTESARAYTHVPHTVKAGAGADGLTGRWGAGEQQRMADRMEARRAVRPGFRSRIRAAPKRPVKGLYPASASAHPGGGVHGAPGADAARAAIRSARGTTATAALFAVQRLLAHRGRTGDVARVRGEGPRPAGHIRAAGLPARSSPRFLPTLGPGTGRGAAGRVWARVTARVKGRTGRPGRSSSRPVLRLPGPQPVRTAFRGGGCAVRGG